MRTRCDAPTVRSVVHCIWREGLSSIRACARRLPVEEVWAEEDCEGKSMPASILSLHCWGRTPREEAAILHFSFHLVRINIHIDRLYDAT